MITYKKSALVLTTLVQLSCFSSVNVYREGDGTPPKLSRKISISKHSEWIHEQFRDDKETTENRSTSLSQRRKTLIKQIEALLRKADNQTKLTADNYVELSLRLSRYYLEEYYSFLDLSIKTPLYQRSAIARLNDADFRLQTVIRKFPAHKRMDEATYLYAIVQMDEKHDERAMKAFENIINKFPKSTYVAESHVQLGDYAFVQANLPQAELHYDALLQGTNQVYRSYATYKKAWCAYNTGRNELSISLFDWIIENEDNIQVKGAFKLKQEVIKEIAYPLTNTGSVSRVIDYYRRFDQATFRSGVDNSANLWLGSGKFHEAIQIWDYLVLNNPTDVRNIDYDINTIEALFQSDRKIEAVSRLLEKLEVYFSPSSPVPSPESRKRWEELTRKYGAYYHGIAERMNVQENYGYAEKLYVAHGKYFSTDPESITVLTQAGRLYAKLGMNERSAYSFLRAAQKTDDEKRQLLLWDGAMEQLSEDFAKYEVKEKNKRILAAETLGVANRTTPPPFTSRENRFHKITLEYVKKFPKSPHVPYYSYQIAYMNYVHKNFDIADQLFRGLIQNPLAQSVSVDSAYHLLDIQNQKEDWTALVKDARWILEGDLRNKSAETNILNIIRHAELKRINKLESEEKYADAAKSYVDFTTNFAKQAPELHEIALYNASVNLRRSNQTQKALEVEERFVDSFPSSRFLKEVYERLARQHEIYGNFEKSARYYEKLASSHKLGIERVEPLYQSALLYWGAGKVAAAEKILLDLSQHYPGQTVRAERFLDELYSIAHQTEKQIQLYQTALNNPRLPLEEVFIKKVKLAELRYPERLPASLQTELVNFGKKHRSAFVANKETNELLSKLLLVDLNTLEGEYLRLKIPANESKQPEVLSRKIALLKNLERELGSVAALGSTEWGIAAIYRTAQLHANFADELANVPPPSNLSAAATEDYQKKVSTTFVTPFREKANGFAEQCVRESYALRILSPFTVNCVALMQRLYPSIALPVRTLYLPSLQLAKGDAELSSPALLVQSRVSLPLSDRSLLAETIYKNYASDLASLENRGPFALLEEQKGNLEKRNLAGGSGSLNELYELAFSSPQVAIRNIQASLKEAKTSEGLLNLLAMAQLNAGNFPAAKVTWLSLLNRTQRKGDIYNNLGVLYAQFDREREATPFFESAVKLGSQEAAANLGFLALKYHNGGLANDYLGKANPDSLRIRVGQIVSLIQQGKAEQVKEQTATLASSGDIYGLLTASYFLVDAEKNYPAARTLLSESLSVNPQLEMLPCFRKIQEEVRERGKNTVITASTPE